MSHLKAILLVGGLVLVMLGGQRAGARSAPPPPPLQVQSASVAQDGEQLVWRLTLAQPFSAAALTREHRSLCLVLGAAGGAGSSGALCFAGPAAHGRVPRLTYTPARGSRAGISRVIPAAVTRAGERVLTVSFRPADVGLGYRSFRWQILSTAGPQACPPASPPAPAGACQAFYPPAPARVPMHIPRLVGCLASGPRWVFNGPSDVHDIALTFDDGPAGTPPTADFVDLLNHEHVPATFFEIGAQISQYDPHGVIERRMLADGDMIGDHTWSHPDLTRLSPAAQRRQLTTTATAIRRATGFTPCLLRAPYGAVNTGLQGVARALGFTTVQWDVDPRDWSSPGSSAIAANVIANAHNGAIVIQHFGGGPRYQTLQALPREIAALRARGYRFVTVTQMLGYTSVYR